jgi:hypothetical protein
MSDLKTRQNEQSVQAFLEGVPDEKRRQDAFTILELMKETTGLPPKMWGDAIVGFGSYHYKYASGREGDWFQVGFSPRKQNLTLYISRGLDRYEALLNRLGKFKTGKSCLYVKKLDDIELDSLREIVRQAVEAGGG